MNARDEVIFNRIRASTEGETAESLAPKFQVSQSRMARVLNVLAADGYIRKAGRRYNFAVWRVCEGVAAPVAQVREPTSSRRHRPSQTPGIDSNTATRVREFLAERDMIAREMGARLGVHAKHLAPTLSHMERRGEIERVGQFGRTRVTIWGLARVKEDAPPLAPIEPPHQLPPMEVHASLTAMLLGDPLPSRSALAQREGRA